MKTEMEIARAHDVLVGFLLQEVPVPFKTPEDKARMSAACGVLCWVLEHTKGNCGDEFAENLRWLEAEAAKRGFVLSRKNN